ncbi:hypothetical protein BH11ACT6_BH11ACT6_50020 [soil metagenome]
MTETKALPEPHPGARRVTVYIDACAIDLALPAQVPVAVLTPAIRDTLHTLGGPAGSPTDRLSVPGHGSLDPALTLAENGIRDGAVLIMATCEAADATSTVIDPAAAVAAIRPTRHWLAQPAVARRVGALTSIVMAALTGFLLVPGGPGLPNVLLASAAAAAVTVISAHAGGDRSAVIAAAACLTVLSTAVALTATLAGLHAAYAGALLTAISVALLTLAGRMVVRVHGMSPALFDDREQLAAMAAGARTLLGGLVGGAAAGAALGVLAAVSAAASWPRCAFATVVAMVLCLGVRDHPEPLPAGALLLAAIICGGAALVILDQLLPMQSWLVCLATATVGAVALWGGVRPPSVTLSPVAARALTVVEHLLLMAVVPLACWSAGAFQLVRGWVLP